LALTISETAMGHSSLLGIDRSIEAAEPDGRSAGRDSAQADAPDIGVDRVFWPSRTPMFDQDADSGLTFIDQAMAEHIPEDDRPGEDEPEDDDGPGEDQPCDDKPVTAAAAARPG
jgi:hypothetical protein